MNIDEGVLKSGQECENRNSYKISKADSSIKTQGSEYTLGKI